MWRWTPQWLGAYVQDDDSENGRMLWCLPCFSGLTSSTLKAKDELLRLSTTALAALLSP